MRESGAAGRGCMEDDIAGLLLAAEGAMAGAEQPALASGGAGEQGAEERCVLLAFYLAELVLNEWLGAGAKGTAMQPRVGASAAQVPKWIREAVDVTSKQRARQPQRQRTGRRAEARGSGAWRRCSCSWRWRRACVTSDSSRLQRGRPAPPACPPNRSWH